MNEADYLKNYPDGDVLRHLRIFEFVDPECINAAIWKSQYLVDRCLPDGICGHGKGGENLIAYQRWFHRGVALWLDHLILGNDLNPRAYTEFALCQPYAQIDKLFYDLIIFLHPRPEIEHPFLTPVVMWEEMRFVEFDIWALGSGALTGNPCNSWAKGKNEMIKRIRQHTKKCVEYALEPELIPRKGESPEWNTNPREFLVSYAAGIAAKGETEKGLEEGKKRIAKYLEVFAKEYTEWLWAIDDSNQIEVSFLLPTGEVFIGGKGKKIPTSKLKTK